MTYFFISLSRHLILIKSALSSGSPILDKQVNSNIIVGGRVGLWRGSVVTCLYIYIFYLYTGNHQLFYDFLNVTRVHIITVNAQDIFTFSQPSILTFTGI